VHMDYAPSESAQVSSPGDARALSSRLWRGGLIGLLGLIYREYPKPLLMDVLFALSPDLSGIRVAPGQVW
jgi:hypothetical protein